MFMGPIKNPDALSKALSDSGLEILIERSLFVDGWHAYENGQDKPVDEKRPWNDEFLSAGYEAARETL